MTYVPISPPQATDAELARYTHDELHRISDCFIEPAYGGLLFDAFTAGTATNVAAVITNWTEAFGGDAIQPDTPRGVSCDAVAGTLTVQTAGVYIVAGRVNANIVTATPYVWQVWNNGAVTNVRGAVTTANVNPFLEISLVGMLDLADGDVLDTRISTPFFPGPNTFDIADADWTIHRIDG